MTCNCQNSTSSSGYTVIIPAGCLGNTEIDLQCKSPQEAVYYQFSLQNRLQSSEMITSVVAEPSDGTNVVVDNIIITNQYFKCRINGGNLNTLAGIRFLITTNNNSVREFDVTLPILPAGVIKDGDTGKSYIIGDKGGVGEKGQRGSLWYYRNSDPIASGIYNTQDTWLNTTSYDVFVFNGTEWKLNGNLKGAKGDQGEAGKDGENGKDATQILTSNVDPTQKDAKENLLWLNISTGNLFETIPVDNEKYTWSKIGNLKGPQGEQGIKGIQGETGAAGADGKQGKRGSIWFFATENPTSGDIYIAGDCFLNTATYDYFINNGTNWQENGNLRGAKGDQGEAGKDGENGKDETKIEDISITPSGVNFTMSDGTSLDVIPEGIYIQDGIVTVPETIGKLPDDLVLNGNIYTAPDAYLNGTKQLPAGLSLNSNIVMTDGSVYFPTTNNNNGVLCAA